MFDTHQHVYTIIYWQIQLYMYVRIWKQLYTWIIGDIQLLTDINIDTQLYNPIYSCLRTLECANCYIHGLQVDTAFDTH